MSKCIDEAFQLARMHGQMELYAEVLGKHFLIINNYCVKINFIIYFYVEGVNANPEDYESVALYFEKENNNFLAGKYYFLGGSYQKVI